jgi:hypothetical protein
MSFLVIAAASPNQAKWLHVTLSGHTPRVIARSLGDEAIQAGRARWIASPKGSQ